MPMRPPIHGAPMAAQAKAAAKRTYDAHRGSASSRGYNYQWTKARDLFIRKNPLCILCQREGRTVQATIVDHRTPHRGDMVLFWDESNWQSLCKPCHDKKTAREDGGFGH